MSDRKLTWVDVPVTFRCRGSAPVPGFFGAKKGEAGPEPVRFRLVFRDDPSRVFSEILFCNGGDKNNVPLADPIG